MVFNLVEFDQIQMRHMLIYLSSLDKKSLNFLGFNLVGLISNNGNQNNDNNINRNNDNNNNNQQVITRD